MKVRFESYIFSGMDISNYIKVCCVKCGDLSQKELAERLGTSPQNLSKKVKLNDWKVSDLEKIAEALGASVELKFVKNDTKEVL